MKVICLVIILAIANASIEPGYTDYNPYFHDGREKNQHHKGENDQNGIVIVITDIGFFDKLMYN